MDTINMDYLKIVLSYKECAEITQHFDFPYAAIKGEALSLMAYGEVGKRNSSDIDLLIPPKYIGVAKKILNANGFYYIVKNSYDKVLAISMSHQSPTYVKKTKISYIYIDLNHNSCGGEYTGKQIDMSDFLSNTIDIEIYGCKIKTLPPIKMLIQLILHHYKDMNSISLLATRKSIKQSMFDDVYYLIKNNLKDISLDRFYHYSKAHGIVPYIYYVLYHVGILFQDEQLNEYISAFRTTDGERLLKCYGLNDGERREWKCDFITRLRAENFYDLIKDDLTEKNIEKIKMNRRVFLGG
ncbi:MAG: nucleotidyltransferase family protein [Clostridiales bacterium]|nr:nucleotidyltransferase family protein [Clostridiales bacterium]